MKFTVKPCPAPGRPLLAYWVPIENKGVMPEGREIKKTKRKIHVAGKLCLIGLVCRLVEAQSSAENLFFLGQASRLELSFLLPTNTAS